MSFATNIGNLATRIGTEFKTIRTLISGSGTGDVSGLSTTATDLVAAINEVKATADAAGSSGGLTEAEVDARVQVGVDALIDGAPGALDTLNELAAAVADDASYAASVTAALAAKANSADVYTRTELGDPTTNYLTTFEAALT